MYCANCGSLINETLKYCKSCGVRLVRETEKDDSSKSILNILLTAIFLITVFGFGILVGLVGLLLKNPIPPEALVMITFAYLAVLFGISFTLLKQIPKLIDARLNQKNQTSEIPQPVQIQPGNTAQLDEHREPVMSVTEHTTRILEKELVK